MRLLGQCWSLFLEVLIVLQQVEAINTNDTNQADYDSISMMISNSIENTITQPNIGGLTASTLTQVQTCSTCSTKHGNIFHAMTTYHNDSVSTNTHKSTIDKIITNVTEIVSQVNEKDQINQNPSIKFDSIEYNSTDLNSLMVENNSNSSTESLFLSFDEWKKLKEDDAAQLNQKGQKNTLIEDNNINNVNKNQNNDKNTNNINSNRVDNNSKNTNTNETNNNAQEEDAPSQTKLNDESIKEDQLDEDQGKVYKDKFNYASIDCAATIIKTNSQAKGASAILVENKDSYLLNQCSVPNKFVIIELCQDILIDSVVAGNFEFFSSMFHNIRISVSDRFPTTQWTVLGEFEAENIRDLQSFKIENPLIWARYLKLEILSHYGDEFYCPLSVVRVHGKTMMEEFKMTEEKEATEIEQEKNNVMDSTLENISTINPPNTSEECAVVLPHLALLEFLKDVNSTTYDYCEAVNIPEPESSHTMEAKTTQESIYKNIMKRLSLLESNASLSLLYIEEQSKLLSTAFTKLERRQSQYFESLVDSFNKTMLNQLAYFKDAYTNIQVETTSLLETQESNHKQLLEESSNQIIVIGNELRFQKRLALFNSVIILILLVYVILTRDVYVGSVEPNDNRNLGKLAKYNAEIAKRMKKATNKKQH